MDAGAPNAQLARNGCHAKPLRIERAHLFGLSSGGGRPALVFAFSLGRGDAFGLPLEHLHPLPQAIEQILPMPISLPL